MKFSLGQKVCNTIDSAKRSGFFNGAIIGVFANFAVPVAAGMITKDSTAVHEIPGEKLNEPWYLVGNNISPESSIMALTSKIETAIKQSTCDCGSPGCADVDNESIIAALEKIAADESASLPPV